ncbi:MAG: hypothetical protein NT163_01700 [Chlorobiales bacterium]|nr:hypothetical protein [Chlorobiales bacterium]
MNERFFLKLLLVLFSGLIVAELLVVLFFGLKLELILLCFILVAALTGIVFIVRLLFTERTVIDSVSMRRAKEKSNDIMQDRLKEYTVDEEFLGSKPLGRGKENLQEPSFPEHFVRAQESILPVADSVDEAIRVHAEMYGGLGELLKAIEKIDEASFSRLVKTVGFGRVSREEIMHRIALMADKERDSGKSIEENRATLPGFSLDRESFDLYIQRNMSSSESEQESADKGFSVELDQEGLSKGTGTMPEDFSHDPKAVFSKLNKPGARS